MIISQVIINSLIAGSLYALVGLGFALIYNVLKFMPFFYGTICIWGGYLLYFYLNLKIPFSLGIILAIVSLILTNLILNRWLLKKFREKGASSVILLIISLALAIFFENLSLAFFGPNVRTINLPFENKIIKWGGATFTISQLIIILISLPFLVLIFYLLYRTRSGLVIRALASEPSMAEFLGVDKEKIFNLVFISVGLVGSIVGILYTIEYHLEPTIGTNLTIKAFTASIIGSLEFLPGVMIGGLFLGFIENLVVLFLPTAFKDGIIFIILFLFLLLKPKGIFGRKTREEISG
ncbi:MAG: branched-chain amino acid ABC transporter permease [Patescibacteria group bacterium]|nr:branched-chain amino acid ABC transporter permease [Patescibacteria group bacterium]